MEFDYCLDRTYATKMGRYITQQELKFILDSLGNKAGLKILDDGGGTGRMSLNLKNGICPIVTEINKIPLEILKLKNPRITSICSDGQYLPFKSKKFDVVLAIQVIDSPKDKDKFLKESYRVLKKEGFLIITMVNKFSYKFLHPNRIRRPTFYFNTYWEFKKRLENSGFDVEKARGYRWIPFGKSSNSSLITKFQKLENSLKFYNFPAFSPGVIFKAVKN